MDRRARAAPPFSSQREIAQGYNVHCCFKGGRIGIEVSIQSRVKTFPPGSGKGWLNYCRLAIVHVRGGHFVSDSSNWAGLFLHNVVSRKPWLSHRLDSPGRGPRCSPTTTTTTKSVGLSWPSTMTMMSSMILFFCLVFPPRAWSRCSWGRPSAASPCTSPSPSNRTESEKQ